MTYFESNNNFFFYIAIAAAIYYLYISSNLYTGTTTATVSNLVCSLLGRRCSYDYTYVVDGKTYTGKRYRGIKPSSTITIKYNPSNPSQSII